MQQDLNSISISRFISLHFSLHFRETVAKKKNAKAGFASLKLRISFIKIFLNNISIVIISVIVIKLSLFHLLSKVAGFKYHESNLTSFRDKLNSLFIESDIKD